MRILEVAWDRKALFLERPNRFTGIVEMDGNEEVAHIHDPGRLEELLYRGNQVILRREDSPKRKTKWELIASQYGDTWVFTNSGYHRKISERLIRMLFPSAEIIPEVRLGHSRIDFMMKEGERITYIEVKGCTLTENDTALFPDAPTERGRRHLKALMDAVDEGKNAMLMILVFREDSVCFSPNERTDPKFAETYRRALKKGVSVRPVLLRYDGRDVRYLGDIETCREKQNSGNAEMRRIS